ncbi:MAG: hypothetical protein J7474_11430 [Arthrobacter sp.]|nr:hypothetical protein [Arthrobacter sp.]
MKRRDRVVSAICAAAGIAVALALTRTSAVFLIPAFCAGMGRPGELVERTGWAVLFLANTLLVAGVLLALNVDRGAFWVAGAVSVAPCVGASDLGALAARAVTAGRERIGARRLSRD